MGRNTRTRQTQESRLIDLEPDCFAKTTTENCSLTHLDTAEVALERVHKAIDGATRGRQCHLRKRNADLRLAAWLRTLDGN